MPIWWVCCLRRCAGNGQDPLMPPLGALLSTGRHLEDDFLARHLADVELGNWALGHRTLNLIAQQMHALLPKAVLEFGCGISTVCLAQCMRDLHGRGRDASVYSIEQDDAYVETTRLLLEKLGLVDQVRFLHSPLRDQVIDGIAHRCYHLPTDVLRSFLGRVRPDFVLIDGPSAERGARYGTLPLVHAFLSAKTHFYMDDALRDGEIDIAKQWSRLPYVRVRGLIAIEKGLLAGTVAGEGGKAPPTVGCPLGGSRPGKSTWDQ